MHLPPPTPSPSSRAHPSLLPLHALCITLLLLGGFGLLSLSIARGRGPFTLLPSASSSSSSSSSLSLILRFRLLTSLLGVSLALAGLSGLLLLAVPAPRARAPRVVFASLAVVALVASVCVAGLSFVAHARAASPEARAALEEAWAAAVVSGEPGGAGEVCDVEEKFRCRGFQDYDCVGCVLGTEEVCSRAAGNAGDRCARCGVGGRDPARGCWGSLRKVLKETYMPLGVVCVLLAFVLVGDLVCVAVLWGKEDRREADAARAARKAERRKLRGGSFRFSVRSGRQGGGRGPMAETVVSPRRPRVGTPARGAAAREEPGPLSPRRKPTRREEPKNINAIPRRPPRKYPHIQ